MTIRIDVRLMGVYSNYHKHKKLQEQELNQSHNKENKSQEMQTPV
jgi:hypothetical protein